ncbi:MAG: hypothetical protein ACTSRZ_02060 [Promethearchaeota archaeon]
MILIIHDDFDGLISLAILYKAIRFFNGKIKLFEYNISKEDISEIIFTSTSKFEENLKNLDSNEIWFLMDISITEDLKKYIYLKKK